MQLFKLLFRTVLLHYFATYFCTCQNPQSIFLSEFMNLAIGFSRQCLTNSNCTMTVMQTIESVTKNIYSLLKQIGGKTLLSAQQQKQLEELQRLREEVLAQVYPKNKHPLSQYYHVIKIDSLMSIGEQGFPVYTYNRENNQQATDNVHVETMNKLNSVSNAIIVSTIGDYNSGKTFTGNLIINGTHQHGYSLKYATEGISLMLPSSSEGQTPYTMVVLDTQGFQRAAPEKFILDRAITDEFIQAMVVDLSDIVIYVVTTLRITDQLKIKILQKEMASKDTENTKKLFILHNFMHLFEISDVQEYIKTDIIDAFGGTEIQNLEGESWYQSKMISKFPVVHFIMANAFSEAGEYYNAKTIRLLQKFISTYPTTSRKINMTEAVMDHLHKVLPSYFYPATLTSRAQILGANQTFMEVVQYKQSVLSRFYEQIPHTVVESTKSWFFGNSEKKAEQSEQKTPDYFQLVYVTSNDLNSSNGYIRLAQPRKLQYLPMDSVSGRPDYFPKISVDELISNDLWKLYIDAPGSHDIQWSVQFFENDLPLFTIQATREFPADYSKESSAFRKARNVLHISRFTDDSILHNVLNANEMAYTIKTQERQFGRWVRHVQISAAVMTDTIKTEYINGVILVQGKLRQTTSTKSDL